VQNFDPLSRVEPRNPCSIIVLPVSYRVFHTNCGWVSSLKKYFHNILDIYGYHICWYVFIFQGCQLFIEPNWCETPCSWPPKMNYYWGTKFDCSKPYIKTGLFSTTFFNLVQLEKNLVFSDNQTNAVLILL
jgi:hypothetical protein